MLYRFDWDPNKARVNLKKHRVGFEQAVSVFMDEAAITIYDDDHSETEDRSVTIGRVISGIIVVVVHTYEAIDNTSAKIRLISARKATKNEIQQYLGNVR